MRDIHQLLEIVDESEAMELKVLNNARIQCLKAYKEEPTSQKKRDWDVAKAGLDEMVKSLNEKYAEQPESGGSGPVFDNIYQVVEHLDNAGFRISKSKLYRDKDKAMIRVNPDGSVPETEVRAYASTLERKDGNIDDLSDIHAQKTKKEVEKLEEQIAKARFEREKEEGKYIPKKDFEAELAARAATLDAGFRHLFNSRVREWVSLVNGDVKKSADFLQDLNNSLNELLNQYAVTDSFSVIFTGEE